MVNLRRIVRAALVLIGSGTACNAILGIDAATNNEAPAGCDPNGDRVAYYCCLVNQNCSDPKYQQYFSVADCEYIARGDSYARPETYTPFELTGDASADSLACRLDFAQNASGGTAAQAQFCHEAGPLSETCGGDVCKDFCNLYGTVCDTDNPPWQVHWTSRNGDTCLDECESLLKNKPTTGGFTAPALETDPSHPLDCRVWHLETAVATQIAGGGDPQQHCFHAWMNNTADNTPCGDAYPEADAAAPGPGGDAGP
jgi:hypothetical protein